MGAAQSELSMDEILASIRRIIHEEEETKQPVRPNGENTVVLSEERAAQAAAGSQPTTPDQDESEADLETVAAALEAAETAAESADSGKVEPTIAAAALAPIVSEPLAAVTDGEPLHTEQPFEAISPEKLASTPEPDTDQAPAAVSPPVSEAAQPIEDDTPMPATQPASQSPSKVEPQGTSPTLVGEQQSQNVAAAFASLKQHVQVTQQGGKTLEDMVAQMIQPMLKAWLNEHLPGIVERKVEEEVRRLSDR